MEKTTVHCDRCGEVKKTSNHWFNIYIHLDEIYITKYAKDYSKVDKSNYKILDICGDRCLIMEVQDFANRIKEFVWTNLQVEEK